MLGMLQRKAPSRRPRRGTLKEWRLPCHSALMRRNTPPMPIGIAPCGILHRGTKGRLSAPVTRRAKLQPSSWCSRFKLHYEEERSEPGGIYMYDLFGNTTPRRCLGRSIWQPPQTGVKIDLPKTVDILGSAVQIGEETHSINVHLVQKFEAVRTSRVRDGDLHKD